MAATIHSIASQRSGAWEAIVVANRGADLPAMPSGFDVVRVDFAPAILPPSQEERLEAVRRDKGGRILAGLIAGRPKGHVMVVDYDDLVRFRLSELVSANPTSNGWYFETGFLYSGGEEVLAYESRFYAFCGTSHIVRADLLRIPAAFEQADQGYVSQWLGSHKAIKRMLEQAGTPLERLPFPGAIYRIGHADATSRSGNIRRFLNRKAVKPQLHVTEPQPLDKQLRNAFFGGLGPDGAGA
ncbi:galactosyl transferase [Muricoccus aerilatus]|uniref:galactosyl transferase n=1 Tax=Muricoccus aerilatus TaxID=452982 RepID=UPI0012EC3BFA|nr:galactosyl transferase [Roseomonas aerilata]